MTAHSLSLAAEREWKQLTLEDFMNEQKKQNYQFTRFSSYAEPVTLDQDGWKVKPQPVAIKFWTALLCVLSLKHFGGGVRQDVEGDWRCKRCHRRVSI